MNDVRFAKYVDCIVCKSECIEYRSFRFGNTSRQREQLARAVGSWSGERIGGGEKVITSEGFVSSIKSVTRSTIFFIIFEFIVLSRKPIIRKSSSPIASHALRFLLPDLRQSFPGCEWWVAEVSPHLTESQTCISDRNAHFTIRSDCAGNTECFIIGGGKMTST